MRAGVSTAHLSPHWERASVTGEQFPAGLGEVVFVAGRVFAVRPAFDDAGSLQLAESVGEDVAGRPGVAGDTGEAVHAVADLAQGQERPPLAKDVQSACE